MKKYYIKCWVRIEYENEVFFENLEEANTELEQARLEFPQNIYEIEILEE